MSIKKHTGIIMMDMGPLTVLPSTINKFVENGLGGLFCIMEDNHCQRYPVKILDSMNILQIMRASRDHSSIHKAMQIVPCVDKNKHKFMYYLSKESLETGLLEHPIQAVNYSGRIEQAIVVYGTLQKITKNTTAVGNVLALQVAVNTQKITVAIKEDSIDHHMQEAVSVYQEGKKPWISVAGHGKIISLEEESVRNERMFINNVQSCKIVPVQELDMQQKYAKTVNYDI